MGGRSKHCYLINARACEMRALVPFFDLVSFALLYVDLASSYTWSPTSISYSLYKPSRVTRSATREDVPKLGMSVFVRSTASAIGASTRAEAREAATKPLADALAAANEGVLALGTTSKCREKKIQ